MAGLNKSSFTQDPSNQLLEHTHYLNKLLELRTHAANGGKKAQSREEAELSSPLRFRHRQQ
jgi:hypothetical protein